MKIRWQVQIDADPGSDILEDQRGDWVDIEVPIPPALKGATGFRIAIEAVSRQITETLAEILGVETETETARRILRQSK